MAKRWCTHCGNNKRFIIRLTLVTGDNSEKQARGLAVQMGDMDNEVFYWIKGTVEVEEGRGPSWTPGTAHIFCGICGNNKHIDDADIDRSNIRGYKGIEVFLTDEQPTTI